MSSFNFKSILLGTLTGVLSLLAPLKASFIVILIVIAADFITGVWASRIKKVSISSKRLRKSISKTLGYFEVIFILFIIEYGFDFTIGTYRFVGGFICFVELVSILENTALISENKIFLNIIKILRGNAKSKYGEIVDEIIKQKNEE